MNSVSTENNLYNVKDKNKTKSPRVSDLSPITNLTLNLSGLSTSIAGTPIRRISWSNPVPGGNKISLNPEDLSCTESPTFQDIFPRRNKIRHRIRKCKSKALLSESEDEKENIVPLDDFFDVCQANTSDDSIQCSSQDSGYSGISEEQDLESVCSPFTKHKQFLADDENEFDNLFHLREIDGEDKLLPVSLSMSSLLTKSISKPHKSPNLPISSRYRKLPIRRCLSMEMDSESDSSSSESKLETFIAPSTSDAKDYSELKDSTKNIFKRPEPPNKYLISYNKRRKSSASVKQFEDENKEKVNFVFQRSYSETAATIMHALLKADLQPELIGDGSRSYALPLCKGRNQDLKSISPETLARLLKGDFKNKIESFTLVDCRYPYEFEGGHIQGAKNIYTKEDIISALLENSTTIPSSAVVFHCEFSSERAPNLCRFLRNKDREMNEGNYPHLHHPEIYILEGGYKAFFENHRELCDPQDYKPMNHKDHGFELRHFRAKSKSWSSDCKGRAKLRNSSKQMHL